MSFTDEVCLQWFCLNFDRIHIKMNNVLSLCRVCLKDGKIGIFDELNPKTSISMQIMACAPVKVIQDDGFPTNICKNCLQELNIAYNFRLKCEASEGELKKIFLQIHNREEDKNSLWLQDNNSNHSNDFNDTIIKEEIDIYEEHPKFPLKNKKKESNRKLSKTKSESTVKRKDKKKSSLKTRKMRKESKTKTHIEDFSEPFQKPKIRNISRKHMCTICGKTFLYQGNLLDHERVHSGDKPFSCNICNRSFAQAAHLKVHERTHNGVKPYQCEICSRSFSISQTLKKHLRTHTGERPYICTICGKSFVTSYHLSNHAKRHTGERDFKCDWPGCSDGFVNVSEMKRHKIRHFKPNPAPKDEIKSLKTGHNRLQLIPVEVHSNFPSKLTAGHNIKMTNEYKRLMLHQIDNHV